MFLKILQYSQENTCVGVSLRAFKSTILSKKTPTLMFCCEYWEIFKNTYFEEHLRTTASYFMKKNRHSWRLNNSSKKILNQWKSMNLQFCKMTCLQRKIQRNAWTVPPCHLTLPYFPHVIVKWNLSRLDGLKFYPGKPGSCNHHLSRKNSNKENLKVIKNALPNISGNPESLKN